MNLLVFFTFKKILNFNHKNKNLLVALCEQAELEYLDAVAVERQSREREPHKTMEWEAKYLKFDED